jgi:hypothetical protein
MENKKDKFDMSILTEEIEILEISRKKIVKKINVLNIIIGTMFIVLSALLFILKEPDTPMDGGTILSFLVISAIPNAIVYFTIYYFFTKKYFKEFKNKIIKTIVNKYDLKYEAKEGIEKKVVYDSEIFKEDIDRFRNEDKISGKIKDIDIELSEIECKYITRDSNNKTSYITFFEGIFFKAKFNKNLKFKTVIVPDSKAHVASFGDSLGLKENHFFLRGLKKITSVFDKISTTHNNIDNIKLENIKFEEMFEVFSQDEIEGRYILTPDMMEKMIAFKEKHESFIYFSFIGDNINIAIEFNENLFEAPVNKEITPVVEKYLGVLNFLFSIVEDLKLDNDIYKKQ